MRISSYRSVLAFVGMLLSAGAASAQIGPEFQILQVPFIENVGQVDEQVRFYANTFAGTVFVTDRGEIVYSLTKTGEEIVIKERPGSPKESELKGINKAETKVNYFVGDKDKWRTNIPAWQEVSIGEVYEGIELKLRAYGNNVEKLFTVHPQGSVSDIKIKIEGSKGLTVNKDGALEVETELGTVKFTKPVAYQEINDQRAEVAVAYKISQSEYGFQVGDYDRSKTLIIDPALVYSTYLGRSGRDTGMGISVDSSGNIYVSGNTNSTDFPTESPFQGNNSGGKWDIFVTKINASGTALIYSTYFGGNNADSGCGNIAVDSSGNVSITGYTKSTDFPITASAYQKNYAGGGGDAFVTKINASGSGLVYSTYLGGDGFDWACGWSIDVDSSGNAYVVGQTNSTDFPTTASAYQENKSGNKDAFITKINATGSGLVYSTYLGGSSHDGSWSIEVDISGNAYIGGYTQSTNFPTTASAYQEDYRGGGMDAFVTKINASGSLVYSTYLGGSGTDYGHGIAVDSSGNAYATGKTDSANFPTASPLQENYGGGTFDAFVTKINASGSGLVYSTYLGGSAYDYGWGFDVDSSGNAYITGRTDSSNFPTASPIQGSNAGDYDGFVTEIDVSGSLVFSTYLGGSDFDFARDIDVDSSGNVYITGYTESANFPTASPLYGTYLGGASDIFVTKMDLAPHITIDSPLNQTYNQTQIWANVTLNENASWCGYSLNGAGNQTMGNDSLTHYYASVSAASGSSNITFYCNDTVGSMSNRTIYFTVDITSQNSTFNISLNSGWNLISIPLEQSNWSLTSVLAPVEGKYNVVFAYDGGWKRSTAPRSPLTDMSLEYGYWINMSEPATLELSGTVQSVTTINVSTGWNLVGHPSLIAQNLTIVLSPINYTVVFEYDDGWKRSTAPRSPLTYMSPGYGYWINATGAGSYEV